MVTQPAYISNLKAYARARYSGDQDIKESVADLSAESDRGAIILAATNIEDMLEYAIVKLLPVLSSDEPARKRMFEQDGQLATFSKKIEMAYAMGIIDEPYRKKIGLIREIRNACAHCRKPLSLERQELRAACEAIMPDMLPHFVDTSALTIRRAFLTKCAFVAHYVGTGEKIEGIDAQVKHYAAVKTEMEAFDRAKNSEPREA